jgi:hypothetical protein
VLVRHQGGDVLADDLGGGVAEDSLGGAVPARDDAIEVLAYDGVIGRFDDGREHLRQLLDLLPPGGGGDAGQRPDIAHGVPLVARLTRHGRPS